MYLPYSEFLTKMFSCVLSRRIASYNVLNELTFSSAGTYLLMNQYDMNVSETFAYFYIAKAPSDNDSRINVYCTMY